VAVTDDLRNQADEAADREDDDLFQALSRIVDGLDAVRGEIEALESSLDEERGETREECETLEALSSKYEEEDAADQRGGDA
jgi:hypothetical protein